MTTTTTTANPTATASAVVAPGRAVETARVLGVLLALPVAVVSLRWWRWTALSVLVLAGQYAGQAGIIVAAVVPFVALVALRV